MKIFNKEWWRITGAFMLVMSGTNIQNLGHDTGNWWIFALAFCCYFFAYQVIPYSSFNKEQNEA